MSNTCGYICVIEYIHARLVGFVGIRYGKLREAMCKPIFPITFLVKTLRVASVTRPMFHFLILAVLSQSFAHLIILDNLQVKAEGSGIAW